MPLDISDISPQLSEVGNGDASLLNELGNSGKGRPGWRTRGSGSQRSKIESSIEKTSESDSIEEPETTECEDQCWTVHEVDVGEPVLNDYADGEESEAKSPYEDEDELRGGMMVGTDSMKLSLRGAGKEATEAPQRSEVKGKTKTGAGKKLSKSRFGALQEDGEDDDLEEEGLAQSSERDESLFQEQGSLLHKKISAWYPGSADKITGMILELTSEEKAELLQDDDLLQKKSKGSAADAETSKRKGSEEGCDSRSRRRQRDKNCENAQKASRVGERP